MATNQASSSDDPNTSPLPPAGFLALLVGSIGVVYGDIGTSPLYAFRVGISAAAGGGLAQSEILGILSLILWSLIVIVTLKYVLFLTRADNHGEGGTLALMALAQRAWPKASATMVVLGAIAASLFYGDAMITPALSVLSAVEGLEVATPGLETVVLPLTVVILIALFAVQWRGTASVAAFFGPITSIWFIAIAIAGLVQILGNPVVLLAVNPVLGAEFLGTHGLVSLTVLGAVFLAVTGAEALYADLGHFGRKPIQVAWVAFVLPALTLNYFGQGALVLGAPATADNPFFLMFPAWARLPMVGLATAATIIASQAVITGAYSLSSQAIQLGLLPRQEIRHTSEAQVGQIYMPRINAILLIGVLLLVGLFRSSDALASAYGIAVTGTMVITAMLAFVVVWKAWNWSILAAIALVVPFFLVDSTFLAANLLKVLSGGWFPLLLGGCVLVLILTWRQGTRILFEKTRRSEVPLREFVQTLEKHPPPLIDGTAVFLTGDPESTPTALLHSLKHFKVLHRHNVIMTVITADKPRVAPADRVTVQEIGKRFWSVIVRYGFAETPNLSRALALAKKEGLDLEIMNTTFFLSRRNLQSSRTSRIAALRNRLFIPLARNADDVSSYFRLPTNRVVEIGTQVTV